MWCDCVGEGKPVKVPEGSQNDHALNQIIMSSMSCIYHQISLGKQEPRVLAFTLNQKIVRFFIVIAQKNVDNTWGVAYFHVKDRNLDLSITGDCVRCLTLGKVLRRRNPEITAELNQLKAQKEAEGVENMVQWWMVKRAKQDQPLPEKLEDDGDRNDDGKRPGPGEGGRDDSGGEKRGDKKPKGDGNSEPQPQGDRGRLSGKGRTYVLGNVLNTLRKLTVSRLPPNDETSY
jgi:hypothetical protein